MKEETLLLQRGVLCFEITEEDFMPKTSLSFKCLGEKLSASPKLQFFVSVVSIDVL